MCAVLLQAKCGVNLCRFVLIFYNFLCFVHIVAGSEKVLVLS